MGSVVGSRTPSAVHKVAIAWRLPNDSLQKPEERAMQPNRDPP
jgi:hypothetical protein